MTLSHDGYGFESAPHDPVRYAGAPELQLIVRQFVGVLGESHDIGETQGRELVCRIRLDGYATTTALQAAIETLESKAGALTGTLTETIGGNNRTWEQCTFLGVELPRDIFNDPNQNWTQLDAILRWRQRKRNT